jgi:foldase protein PrsA
MEQVMGFLISSYWLLGEAQHLNMHLSSIAVRKRFDRLRHAQFRRQAAFKNFLQRSGQTTAELLFRVRINMIEGKIQRRIVGHGDTRSRQRALQRFVAKFQRKWRAQTYCESPYATPDCGHTASSL